MDSKPATQPDPECLPTRREARVPMDASLFDVDSSNRILVREQLVSEASITTYRPVTKLKASCVGGGGATVI